MKISETQITQPSATEMLKFNASFASISTNAEVSRRVSQMIRGAIMLPATGNTNMAKADRWANIAQVRSSWDGGAPEYSGAAVGFESFTLSPQARFPCDYDFSPEKVR